MVIAALTTLEGYLAAATAALCLLPVVATAYGTRNRGTLLATIGLVTVVLFSVAWTGHRDETAPSAGQPNDSNRPRERHDDGYVSSRSCRSCHPHEYATWHGSYHRTMTQEANADSVVGDFDGVTLHGHDRSYHLRRDGDAFWVEIEAKVRPDPSDLDLGDGPPAAGLGGATRRNIVMTTGSHHQQIYWYPAEEGRKVELLPFVYLMETQSWVPHRSVFLRPPDNKPKVQSGLWNMSCIRCHTTHGRPGLDPDDNLDTHVAEFGIACEACHGPGRQHVLANRSPRRRYGLHLTGQSDTTMVQPSSLSHRRSTFVCAQCHSVNQFYTEEEERRWSTHGYRFRPGDDLSQTRMLIRYDLDPQQPRLRGILHYYPQYMEDFFWSDGMIRVSGREFNGLLETPCYQRGELSCLSCHVMHKPPDDGRPMPEWANDQLKRGMEGNEACLQCHDSLRNDLEAHTRHAPESAGSQCYNCHMPFTTYGLLKATRSHQVDRPDVAATLQTGRPNACNLCHLDRTLEWTASHLSAWTGQPPPWLTDEERSIAASLLWLLRGDAGQRALTAWSMGWPAAREASGSGWLAPFLAQLLDDPYDAVRFIAYRSLRTLPGYGELNYDYVGSPEDRRAATGRALNIWKQQRGQVLSRSGDPILIDAGGQLQQDVLMRLLGQRNDRRVNLNE